jgi:acetylornithine/succinyldiaminopimelate/putrescine aminotransferase
VGRTGTLFAYEQFNIKPDIITSAKGLGNGFPIGAILTTNKIAEAMQVGAHGTTFGGNPLACSVAHEVIKTVSKKTLLSSVAKKEKLFIKRLEEINKKLDCFERINTAGLWIGCKLKITDSVNLDTVLKQCYKNGLMVLKANNNTIRIAPSLIIEDELIKSGLSILENSIDQLQQA